VLAALRIAHFAIIDALEVEFGEGLTVLTGETGAGKSILVDALHLALGGRAQVEVVRTGFDEAVVEALFRLPTGDARGRDRLLELGLPDAPDGELLIRRVVQRAGRSKVWVNGSLCSVAVLERLARGLCDIGSQHEHVSLLDPSVHLDLLDAHGGLMDRRTAYGQAYQIYAQASAARSALLTDEAARAERSDYLAFQLREIDELDPQAGEEDLLAKERALLASAAKLRGLAETAEEQLYSGEGSAVERLSMAADALGQIASLDGSFAKLRDALASARAEAEEAARELTQLARRAREDPVRLEAIDDRLAALRRLTRKHGGDIDALLRKQTTMRAELSAIESHAETLAGLERAEVAAREVAQEQASALGAARRKSARALSTALCAELEKLGMPRSRVEVIFEDLPAPGLGPAGAESAELFFSANVGEEVKPLAKIASGGELSRVLLAFKRIGAAQDPVDVYVFDELDSGLGGPTAQVVGRVLKEVSRERQVICITHLAPIAAQADRHLVVRKALRGGRVSSEVELLDEMETRTREVARMLSGEDLTPIALKHARELLRRSAAS
jgi:DNA repair protein RecN (Recombination protein N)